MQQFSSCSGEQDGFPCPSHLETSSVVAGMKLAGAVLFKVLWGAGRLGSVCLPRPRGWPRLAAPASPAEESSSREDAPDAGWGFTQGLFLVGKSLLY